MRLFFQSLILVICTILLCSADWPQFRGPHNASTSADTKLPIKWSEDRNVAWKVELPGRGPSGPIVVGENVFVTCSSGIKQDRLHVICFDAKTGERKWHRQTWASGRTMTHEASANAAPTPASDGTNIYAFFSSNDLLCYDLNGNLQWYRGLGYDFPKAGNDIGMASSPVVAGNTVVCQVESQGESFAIAINAKNGETRWKIDRAQQSNWSSPVTMKAKDGKNLVLLKSSDGLTAREIVSGDEAWSFKVNAGGIPSIYAFEGKVYLPADELTVLDASTGKPEPEVVWASNRVRPGPASPIIYENFVYALGKNILTCASNETGEVLWKLRLKGDFWSTPVLANNHLYCINLEGDAHVVGLSADKGQVVGTSKFGETIQCSPAVANDAMFVRSDKHLWKIAMDD